MAKTISSELLRLAQTKLDIKDAIEQKGVVVGSIPFEDYYLKILDIEGSGSEEPFEPLPVGSTYRGSFSTASYSNVEYQDGLTYSGLMIEPNNTTNGGACINLNNCNNVLIENCYFKGTTRKAAISLYKCSNVTIKNCFFENVFQGIQVQECTNNIKIENNEFLNIMGKLLTAGSPEFELYKELGNVLQFDKVSGVGHSFSFNAVENQIGVSFPEDLTNMYQSQGTSGSPIKIEGNWFRGGSSSNSGGGLMQGDYGGEHIHVINNILVDPGQYGIGVAGGNDVHVIGNMVFGKFNWFLGTGIYAMNFSPEITPGDILFEDNTIAFWRVGGDGNPYNNWGQVDSSMSDAVTIINSGTDVNMDETILPPNIFNRLELKTNGLWYSTTYPFEGEEFGMNAPFISGTTFSAPSFKSDIRVIRVPEGVTTLDSNALGGTSSTSNLRSVVLPSTITNIGANALRHNSEIWEIIIHATTPPTLGTNALSNLPAEAMIRVPDASKAAYRAASGWSTYADKIWSI